MYYTCVHARIHLDKSSSSSTASEGTSTAQDVCVGTTTSCHHGTAAIGSAARALSVPRARSTGAPGYVRVYSCRHARACVSLEPTYPTNDICLHFQPMRRLFVYAFPRKLGLFRVRGEKQTHLEMFWNSVEMPQVPVLVGTSRLEFPWDPFVPVAISVEKYLLEAFPGRAVIVPSIQRCLR